MKIDQREIRRNLRVLEPTETNGSVVKTCRYFGIGRTSFYRCKNAYVKRRRQACTPLGPILIMWYLERLQGRLISPESKISFPD